MFSLHKLQTKRLDSSVPSKIYLIYPQIMPFWFIFPQHDVRVDLKIFRRLDFVYNLFSEVAKYEVRGRLAPERNTIRTLRGRKAGKVTYQFSCIVTGGTKTLNSGINISFGCLCVTRKTFESCRVKKETLRR